MRSAVRSQRSGDNERHTVGHLYTHHHHHSTRTVLSSLHPSLELRVGDWIDTLALQFSQRTV